MGRRIVMPAAVLAVVMVAALPAGAGRVAKRGSFVARALPFPAMEADVYYPQKGSCLDGTEGIHKVSEPFSSSAPGALSIYIEGMSGDWDLYALDTRGGLLGASEKAQVLDGAEAEERMTVAVDGQQKVQMVACNWLGEPEVTVHFDFVAKMSKTNKPRPHRAGSDSNRTNRRATRIEAAGGPVTPLWEWDPSEIEILPGDKIVWLNETATDHHVTPYGGSWKEDDSMHLPTNGKVGMVFQQARRVPLPV